MSCFSSTIKFKYPWRDYQKRVLDDLDSHLKDEHLHVIAPPGSGKTVLGLEVMLRVGAPTLILAPTIAVRNQWVQRFCELFLSEKKVPNWVSIDIRSPKIVTIVTYQSLHAACNNTKEELILVDHEHETDVKERKTSNFLNLPVIVNALKYVGIKTLIVDESHHLKNEWWKTLTKIKQALKPKIVGLTATPPYDVSPQEWQRYLEFNGPIDAEITVPELVQEGDLCIHQDYIVLCEADKEIQQELDQHAENSNAYYELLMIDEQLLEAISTHPVWLEPMNNQDFIYNNLSYYSACLIFLHHKGVGVLPIHLQVLGIEALKKHEVVEEQLTIPSLTREWMQELLSFYLFEENGHFQRYYDKHRSSIEKKLRRLGLLENKRIRFGYTKKIKQQLSTSINKLYAIENIVNNELEALGSDLRQVILTDYIRKEYYTSDSGNQFQLKKIGVFSIFEKLRRSGTKRLGILTGSIIILPIESLESYRSIAKDYGVLDVFFRKLSYDQNYIELLDCEKSKNISLQIVTALFEKGEIRILIGTKSLLGEGWDAPAINSLVLASFVGSYVVSNQMRGRAIRVQPTNLNKTSNIWHIVALDKSSNKGGPDLAMMKRRFRNFVGISEYEIPNIENGTTRLLLPDSFSNSSIEEYQSLVFSRASDRGRLASRWKEALKQGSELVEEIQIPFFEDKPYIETKRAYAKKYIANMVSGLASSILLFFEGSSQIVSKVLKVMPGTSAGYAMLTVFGIGTVFYGRKTFETFQYYRKYRDITKDIYQIGKALVQTLCKCKFFSTPYEELHVLTHGDEEGNVYCHLEGGTAIERSSFIHMMQEIINPIMEPRYIIVRKSTLFNRFTQYDYHAVPELLGKKMALAKDFLHFWNLEVGDAELVNTKSFQGRQLLLRSKFDALSSQFNDRNKIQYVNVWK